MNTTKHIPLEKQTKRAQKEFHAKQRGSWHGLNPITRIVSSKKVYNRNRRKKEDRTIE